MKLHSISRQIILFTCVIVLTACNLPGTVQQTATPTLDIPKTLVAVHTEDAAIIYTQIASQATSTPLPPTATPVPSSTPLPSATLLPSNTPTPTRIFIPWTHTPTATPTRSDLNCSVTNVSPSSNTFDAKADFDTRWTVKNTGSDTWTTTNFAYKYVSGEKMQKYNDFYQLKNDVASGNSFDVTVDMIAPSSSGSYSATWSIVKNSTTICTMSVSIVVR